MVAENRITEIVNYALEESDKAAEERYNISHETLRRYKRAYRADRDESQDEDIKQPVSRVLQDIAERYTDKELQAIAKGGMATNEGRQAIDIGHFDGDTIRFGVITDTHI